MKLLNRDNSKKKKLNWGVSGCGRFTETSFLPSLNLARKAKLVSVYSSNAGRAKFIAEKAGAKTATSDFTEFLNSGIDAVYIAGTNKDHHWQVLEAAKSGKHILCEKPLSLTSVQAQEMVDTCAANNVKIAVSYVYRFHPLIEKLKELTANQVIGKIVAVNAQFNINFIPAGNFRFSKELSGGGALRDLGTHMLDLCRYVNGEMTPLSAVSDRIIYKGEVEDYFSGVLKFNSGGYASIQVSYCVPKAANRFEVIGSKGTIFIDNLIGSRFSSAKMTLLLDGEVKKAFRKRSNKFLRLFRSVNESFLKNTPLQITGEDGLINMKLMEGLEEKCS